MSEDFSKQIGEVLELRDDSAKWLQDNYWSLWGDVYQSYRCVRRPRGDEEYDDEDPEEDRLSVATPLTPAWVNRHVARVTAQTPNPRVRMSERDRSDRNSRGLMYQWDKVLAQQGLEKVTRTASIFGWGVRGWEWADNTYLQTRRVDPVVSLDDPQVARWIDQSYPDIEAQFGVPYEQMAPQQRIEQVVPMLLEQHGRGDLIKVRYKYTAYQGPKPFELSIADCYPEPEFDTLQGSNWFGCERRRRRHELVAMAKQYPSLKDGIDRLFAKWPHGTPLWAESGSTSSTRSFRAHMAQAYPGKRFSDENRTRTDTEMWSTFELHFTGPHRKIQVIGYNDVWIGEVPTSELADLEGMIPFAELKFIDDLGGGIGESLPRWFSGLQLLYDRQVNVRWKLIYSILRPLIGTSNRELFEDPKLVKRGDGFRMVLMRGPGEMWQQNEQAALAAAAAGLQDSSSILALWQMLTGETNTSLSANVDPAQGRTATGAKLIAYTQDLMTRDQIKKLGFFLQQEHRLMYLFNRSESVIEMVFDGTAYRRRYDGQHDLAELQEGNTKIKVQPIDWQDDAEIVVEDGSTLADDDEAKAQAAVRNLQMFGGNPMMNQKKLAEDVLIASGKGGQTEEYFVPPQPQQPPPVTRPSMNVALKYELLDPAEKFGVWESAGIKVPNLNGPPDQRFLPPPGVNATPPMGMPPGMPPPGALPPGAPPPQPPVRPPNLPKAILAPPPEINSGAASVRAVTGRNV